MIAGDAFGLTQQDLLSLIDQMPVGVIAFANDGTVKMINRTASQYLASLLGTALPVTIYEALRAVFPALAENVAAFTAERGLIIDQHRIEARAGQQNVTLALTVTRLRQNMQIAVLKDFSRLTDMAAYAFASADLLVDVDADGVIGWIGGAFKMLHGQKPCAFVGKNLAEIVAPRDRGILSQALMMIAARGRLPPLLLRLAHGNGACCVLAGLARSGTGARFMMTIGPPPSARPTNDGLIEASRDFGAQAEAWLRQGEAGQLGLLDIAGWETTAARLDATQMTKLKAGIAHLAEGESGEAVTIGELAAGRFGVLGAGKAELAQLGDALHDLVEQASPASRVQVKTVALDLAPGALSIAQSVQALRIALSRFGAQGAQEPGLAEGLAGIIKRAGGQRRALATCIEQGKFDMAYQPIVSLSDGALHHYEALLRPRADVGIAVASPGEFVALAEAVGLSEALDLAVLQRTLVALRESGAAIAFNVSGASITKTAFVRQVLALTAGAPSGQVMIELTETSEIQDLEAAAQQIQLLRAAKLPVCLDDFGAGSASFRYLRDLQCDFVKIDGTYCHAARRTEQGRSIVRAMCDLAASAGAETIAEMIETEADADIMRDVGVRFAQGWFFGRPGALPREKVRSEKSRRWRY